MRREPLILVAAGGLATEVLAAVSATSRYQPLGLVDDNPGITGLLVGGVPVLGALDEISRHPAAKIVVCAGSGVVRSRIVDRLCTAGVGPDRFATVVHPAAQVAVGCVVGAGSIVLAGAVFTAGVTVGRHVVLMPQVTLTHDDRVEDFATLCAGVSLGGNVHVGRAAYLGMNSAVRERLTVGAHATLGMGAVLLRDLPAGQTWFGVPAAPRPEDISASTSASSIASIVTQNRKSAP